MKVRVHQIGTYKHKRNNDGVTKNKKIFVNLSVA